MRRKAQCLLIAPRVGRTTQDQRHIGNTASKLSNPVGLASRPCNDQRQLFMRGTMQTRTLWWWSSINLCLCSVCVMYKQVHASTKRIRVEPGIDCEVNRQRIKQLGNHPRREQGALVEN